MPGFPTSPFPPFPVPSRSRPQPACAESVVVGLFPDRLGGTPWGGDPATTSSQRLRQRTTVHGPARSADNAERSAQIVYWAGDRPAALGFLRAGPEAEGSWYSQRPVLLPSGCCLATLGSQALRKSGRGGSLLWLGVLLGSTGGSSHPRGPRVW